MAAIKVPKVVPVFPLPSIVFFPKTYLPLHIYEPRYREMVSDSLAGDRLIGMALLKEGWEPHYYGTPEIYPLGCVGKIVKSEGMQDGRFNIILFGLAKVLFKEPIYEKNYRQAWVDPVQSPEPVEGLSPQLREGLLGLLKEYGRLIGAHGEMELFLRIEMDDPTLVNLFSSELQFTPMEKQFLLESSTLPQHCRRLMELIQFKIHEVNRGQASG